MISDDVKKAFELGKKEGIEETKKWIEGLIDETIRGIDDPKYNRGIRFAMKCLKAKLGGGK